MERENSLFKRYLYDIHFEKIHSNIPDFFTYKQRGSKESLCGEIVNLRKMHSGSEDARVIMDYLESQCWLKN